MAVEINFIADDDTWRWWLNDGMNHSIVDAAKRLKLQITIFNSEDDPVITPQIIKEKVLNVLPNAKLITTTKTGHLIPMENPSWVAEQIKKMVSR